MTIPVSGPPSDLEPPEASGSGSVSEVHPGAGDGGWVDAGQSSGPDGSSVMSGSGRLSEPGGGSTKDSHPGSEVS